MPIYVSGFGAKSVELAARVGDGYISTRPDADAVARFRDGGGADKPAQGGFKACYADTEDEGVRIAHETWPNSGVPGELNQVLPSPRHFEQASKLVTPEMTRKHFVCGPDPDRHLEQIEAYAKAGLHRGVRGQHRPQPGGLLRPVPDEVLPQAR